MDENEEILTFPDSYKNFLLKLGPKTFAIKWRDAISEEGRTSFGKQMEYPIPLTKARIKKILIVLNFTESVHLSKND